LVVGRYIAKRLSENPCAKDPAQNLTVKGPAGWSVPHLEACTTVAAIRMLILEDDI
jgi:hypothetical protein